MASKTNFYFYFNKPATVKIKQVKFKEQIFDIDDSKTVILNGETNWSIPSRFIIKNLSDYPITLNKINFNVEGVDTVKRPIRLENQKKEKIKIINLENADYKLLFIKMILEPNIEYSVKFSCYLLNFSDK